MGKNIEVEIKQLESTAGRIESLAADYKTQYEQLYSETGNMASTWRGEDNTAFINQIEGFKDDLQKMHQLMLNYADFLRKSAKAYRDTLNAVVAEAKKLQN